MEETADVYDEAATAAPEEEQRIFVATQWQLMWWRFRKHRLAIMGSVVVIAFYLVAIFADFLAYSGTHDSQAYRSLMPPQPVHLFDEGGLSPHVYALEASRDSETMRRVYAPNPDVKIRVRLFGRGFKYKLLGVIPTDRHLIGVEGARPEETLFVLGTDSHGRDLWSRLMVATRLSMSIGLVSVVLSLFLGVLLGGLSGFYGGAVDNVIQRVIEIFRSVPTIPLWLGLAAAVPSEWGIVPVYFAITIILSLIGWTGMARVVRGKFLSLREEDFVMAAELAGAGQMRIIFRHLVPSFLSHIIASITLSLPGMILSETALSFLGLGLRPPAISWGVLLQDAQNVQALAVSPWLLIPALSVVTAILAFNFLGDGLRDAADPYA